MRLIISLEENLEQWFHRLGSDDPRWWAKELKAYLTMPNDDGFVWIADSILTLRTLNE